MSEKAAWRPKRFDVAGAHPDEAWRAVSDVRNAVEDIRKQFIGSPEIDAVNAMTWKFLQMENRPMRFGNTPDAEVQRFLERGIGLMDALKPRMALGFSRGQQQVRDRCAELAKSMQKVLDKRPDEEFRPRQRMRAKPKQRM
jgi:hypothetical protein